MDSLIPNLSERVKNIGKIASNQSFSEKRVNPCDSSVIIGKRNTVIGKD